MGDAADDVEMWADMLDEVPVLPRIRGAKGWWIQRDGKRIAIKRMLDSHLRNTIKMLRRNGYEESEKYEELCREALNRWLEGGKLPW